ncbi:MAG: hypothetical protein ACYDDF_00240 [Thermoplasmatota archaeon]
MALRPDIVILLAGVVLFVGGAIGIATIPPNTAGGGLILQAYAVTWSDSPNDIPVGNATLAEAGSGSVPFHVADRNLSRIVFHVTCTDQSAIAGEDVANLVVHFAGPAGVQGNGTVRCSGTPTDVSITLNGPATETTASGTSMDDARNQLLEERYSTEGVGPWAANLTLERPSPLPTNPFTSLPQQPPGGATVTITGTEFTQVPTLSAESR